MQKRLKKVIKVRKSLSLLIIVLMILSNLVFAQYPGSYEGKPIESSGEGSEYYYEGDVVVYPSKGPGSKEEQMMERFMKGNIGEDEMRAMAKAKQGDRFNEMEFQKGMLELKGRMQRKEAFSYENEAFQGKHDIGPSYEGYSKEQMVFGMIFEHIGGDIDPREIKQYCNEPDKIADMLITKLREKVGDLQNICSRAEENEARCAEMAKKGCSQIGIPFVREDATEMEKIQSVAYSCPVNKDAIVQACKLRAKFNMEQRIQHVAESCEKRFDLEGDWLVRECEKFKQYQTCDRERFMSQCMGGIKKENFEKPCPEYPIPSCGENQKLRDKKDARGCTLYYCETIAANECPTASAPQCAEGSALQKKVDDKGCVYYYCSEPKCPEVSKPMCNNDERLEAYFDNAGCAASYQCIKRQTCPEVAKPTCGEGASLTTKYDDKGCIVGYECISITTNESLTSITGGAVLNTYNDFMMHCENSWKEQERICSNMEGRCDQSAFIERCKQQEKKNYDDFVSKIDRHCETETASQISAAEQRCSRLGEERQRCLEQSTKRCEQMKGIAQQCKDLLTEENLRRFIVEEAKKRCKFSNIIQDEEGVRKADKVEIILAVLNTATEDDLQKLGLFVDGFHEELKLQDTTVYKGTIDPNRFGDVKLLPFVVNAKISPVAGSERSKEVKTKIIARQRVEESAGKLASLRDSDLSDEYIYIIEDKASDVLNVSDSLEDIEKKEEQKGIGYKIRLFLGLAKKAEQMEISQLTDGKEKLKNSIEALTSLIEEVPSDIAKAVLKEQVENLKKQQEDIEVLIEVKEKKAKGLFGIFG
ncbi:hypothetical protein HYW20_05100 [Candidatus Woesearchaeota archaeon]|nr:hypothetical protein [Candidatus Woesearchaeota archaeon]